jgi:hypothetical protein
MSFPQREKVPVLKKRTAATRMITITGQCKGKEIAVAR